MNKHYTNELYNFSFGKLVKKCTQLWVISVNSKLIKIKNALNEVSVWVYWTYNRICELDINAHYTGIEPALLSLSAGKTRSALTIRPREHISIRNNEKYNIYRRSNFVKTCKKIMNESWKPDYRLHMYSSSSMKYSCLRKLN